jgi:queuine tRNA-ribosyltransferase
MLGPILVSLHNVTYYQRLMHDAREAILKRRFSEFLEARLAGWGSEIG